MDEIITTRKRSCSKVMFSQVSVCSQEVGTPGPAYNEQINS